MIDASSSALGFFAAEVVRLRKARRLSQPALAKLLNYSPSQVAKIETAERIPKRPLALRLDEVFQADGHFARLQALVDGAASRDHHSGDRERAGHLLRIWPGVRRSVVR